MKSNYLGLLFLVFVVVGIMTLGGSLTLFWSTPGFLAVIGILVGAIVFRFGFDGLVPWRQTRTVQQEICNFGASVSVSAGILATIIGFIQMFAQVEWTDPKIIGLSISLALTTILYGYLFSIGFKMAAPVSKT